MTVAGLLSLIREEVQQMRAYHALAQRPAVILDANESPWPLPAELKEQIAKLAAQIEYHRYPDPQALALRETLARVYGGNANQYVVGSGSDELIALLVTAFSKPRAGQEQPTLVVPSPTFVMYCVTARAHGWQTHEVPLDANWQLDKSAMQDALQRYTPNLVFYATPNNPTGNRFAGETLRTLAEGFPDTLHVVDKAYAAYAQAKCCDWCENMPNVAVLGTLSKIGFAAARVGWIRMNAELATELDKVRQPYNLNAFSQALAVAALTDFQPWITERIALVVNERARVAKELAKIPGWRVYPSDANFLLVEVPDPAVLAQTLLQKQIAIKSYADAAGALGRCVRISVGTPDENTALLAAIAAQLA